MAGKKVKKINFSGHPVTGFEIAPFVGANLPMEGSALAEYVRETLLALPGREELLKGETVELVLPGMSSVAGVLLAEWHGQYGSFPTIRWAVRGAAGFEWPETAISDLQEVRTSARTAR
ncbi:MAG: hypothetical protein EXS55_01170 [Candidatus Magasanikbacteria bacterium]|nr:hypothetical protein [Candidatus Magasanikbacteria bacterium]